MSYYVLAILCVFLMAMRMSRLMEGPLEGHEFTVFGYCFATALIPPVGLFLIIITFVEYPDEVKKTAIYRFLLYMVKERHWRRSDPVEIKGFSWHTLDDTPKLITNDMMTLLTDSYQKRLENMRGKFLTREKNGRWSAADNSTHECWTESFDTFEEALAFLNGKEID